MREGDSTAAMAALASMRRHPIITGVMVGCTLCGAVAGFVVLGPEWSIARRVLGGGVCGAGVGLFITAFKMLG